jgi:hypothetical protein
MFGWLSQPTPANVGGGGEKLNEGVISQNDLTSDREYVFVILKLLVGGIIMRRVVGIRRRAFTALEHAMMELML